MSNWRREQALKDYKEVGLPHFEKFMSDWAEQNKAMLEQRQKETKEEE